MSDGSSDPDPSSDPPQSARKDYGVSIAHARKDDQPPGAGAEAADDDERGPLTPVFFVDRVSSAPGNLLRLDLNSVGRVERLQRLNEDLHAGTSTVGEFADEADASELVRELAGFTLAIEQVAI